MLIKTIDQVLPFAKGWHKAVSDTILVVGLVSINCAVSGFIWFFDRPTAIKILLVLIALAVPIGLWKVLS